VIAVLLAAQIAPPSPEEIFRQAQRAWQARIVPAYESFRIDCANTFLAAQCSPHARVEFVVRTSDGRSYAHTIPTQGAPPMVLLRGGYITGPAETPLGFYRFLGNDAGAPAPSPPPNLAPDPLLTIATVTAATHAYAIALAGEESVDGRLCYHLLLRPTIHPDRYPLRALWVEESSYQVVQLTYERPYDSEHARAMVRYRFAPIGPERIWTIVHIEADAYAGAHSTGSTDHVADDLSDIAFPAAVPDWYFEPDR
jgi:hypothetical protein